MNKILLALGAVVLLALASEAKPNVPSFLSKADGSCDGQCEAGLVPGATCQCNASCSQFGDCCADYADICLSCEGRCDIGYQPNNECQCNDQCGSHGNCCDDYEDFCDGSGNPGGDGDLSNAQLKELSERLILMNDASGISDLVTVDKQGGTSQCSTSDEAPNPFFTTFDESIWTNYPTVEALKKLYDNYNPNVKVEEDHLPMEQFEEQEFLDLVLASDIMQETYRTLVEAEVFTGTPEDFRAKMMELWFEGYDRDGTSANVVGSSGFEHVFMGESKESKVSGFHNWLHFYFEEQAGNIDYLGNLSDADFSGASGITDVFKWNNEMKCIGSMFVGTLPELDLAVYTTCFLTRGGSKCTMSYHGTEFYVTTFDMKQNGKVHIGTAYPDFT